MAQMARYVAPFAIDTWTEDLRKQHRAGGRKWRPQGRRVITVLAMEFQSFLQQHPSQLHSSPCLFLRTSFKSPARLPLPPRISATSVSLQPNEDQTRNVSVTSDVELFACPICFKPLIRKGPSGNNLTAISKSAFKCSSCNKSFSNRDVYLDLTLSAGTKEYDESLPAGTELFRSPFVSFAYERGWRQNFSRSGFPGPDEETKLAQDFLKPVTGGVLLDVSCGSGLFSRRFAKSNVYSTVIASDYSENMLRQCYQFIKQDRKLDEVNLALVRADVARLPFATGTVDAVHAGAALHCWPSPLAGVAEISRILRPGGIFVATTFLSSLPPIDAIKRFQQFSRGVTRYWYEEELEDICNASGLIDYKKIRKGNFIMLSASKPSSYVSKPE